MSAQQPSRQNPRPAITRIASSQSDRFSGSITQPINVDAPTTNNATAGLRPTVQRTDSSNGAQRQRESSRGRQSDGLTTRNPGNHSRQRSNAWEIEKFERDAISFFHEISKPVIIMIAPQAEGFISTLVLELAADETAIKDLLIALATAHEIKLNNSSENDPKLINVYKYINKALPRLRVPQMTKQPHLVLTSCLIFVALHVVALENPELAFDHIRYGAKILQARAAELENGVPLNNSDLIIKAYILPIFETMALSVALSISEPDEEVDLNSIPVMLLDSESDEKKRQKVYELSRWVCKSFQYGGGMAFVKISALLPSWQTWIEAIITKFGKGAPHTLLHAQLLNVYFRMTHLAFRCFKDEMEWDKHNDALRKQIIECRKICQNPTTYLSDDDFLIAPGLYTPLWQIAARCREPSIRRDSMELLEQDQRARRQEEDSPGLQLAKWVMQLEQGSGIDVKSCLDIDEEHRIRLLSHDHSAPANTPVTFSLWPFRPADTITLPLNEAVEINRTELKELLTSRE